MKAITFALCLLAATGCGSKTTDPQPAAKAADAPAVTYVAPNGAAVAVSSWVVYSVTAAPNRPGQDRRSVTVQATFAGGRVLTLAFDYVGSTFPRQTGPVALDAGIRVSDAVNQQAGSYYVAPVTAGTLRVDSVSPQVVSGTYTGPLVAGGPAVSFAFSKLPI